MKVVVIPEPVLQPGHYKRRYGLKVEPVKRITGSR